MPESHFVLPAVGAHRRLNPLLNEWVLVSPHRMDRPWQGQVERTPSKDRPAYDTDCYLCPGNVRASGDRNPTYQDVFVFDNDFAALLPPHPASQTAKVSPRSATCAQPEAGICRVMCYTPRHDLTMAHLTASQLRPIVDAWIAQYIELSAMPFIGYVQVFENKGEVMGCSNPHPHGQIWATESIPTIAAREQEAQQEYRCCQGSCLLCDYVASEIAVGKRTVMENDHFLVIVPFWAVWPFETLLLPRRHITSLAALSESERCSLADILGQLTRRYDALFGVSFPYSMGFHQQPTDGSEHLEWHLHAHFYPPLLRSATVRKFMVGYEMLAEPQRDLTPEQAAQQLRQIASSS